MTVSGMLIVVAAIVLAIWDGWAEYRYGLKATESFFIASTAARYPSLVLAAGVLIGHFLCGMKVQQ